MSREPGRRIADIILCCEKILRFTSGMNKDQLIAQDLVSAKKRTDTALSRLCEKEN